MSVVTDQIKAYRAGKLTLAQLTDWIVRHQFVPEGDDNPPPTPSNLLAREMQDPGPYVDGSWEEVIRAEAYGLITPEEYDAINRAVWTALDPRRVNAGGVD